MAIARPSPLVDRLGGRVGGTLFRDDPRGQVISRLPTKRKRATSLQTQQRLAIARAALTWAQLSVADRAAWNQYAGTISLPRRYNSSALGSGFHIFSAAYALFQPNSIPPPAAPFLPARNMPIEILTMLDAGSLYLTGFSRDLAADEWAVVRIQKPQSPTVNNPQGKALRTVLANDTQGLDSTPARAWIKSASNEYIRRAAALTTSTTWSWSIWFRTGPVAALRRLWITNPPLTEIRIGASPTSQLIFFNDGVSRIAGNLTLDNTWKHVVLSANAGTGLAQFYVNGAAFGPALTYVPNDLTGATEFMGASFGTSNNLLGSLDEVTLWTVALDATQAADLFNGGRGFIPQPQANLRLRLPLDTGTATTTPDVSGNNLDFTRQGGTFGLSAFAQLLIAANEIRHPGGFAWAFSTPWRPTQPYASSVIRRLDLP